MAKIVGSVPPFIGTRDNVTIYLMNGEYIARTKSSLTGKRVKKDPIFARTMEWAGRLKQAARIASFVYKQMPVDERVYKQYREITGKAMTLLKEGFDTEDVITMLEAVYLPRQVEIAGDIMAGTKPAAEQEEELPLLREGTGVEDVITMPEAVYLPRQVEIAEDIIADIKSVIKWEKLASCEQKYAICYGRPTIIWAPYAASGQVGIAGLSCLKYADTTREGFNSPPTANPPSKAP
ncbi:hypothetical protein L3C95_22365 [Chitinophaga filiformis]|uniref:hypothetical protein n=1 Tax=Chitinophaga filiformis TaxID=104663 RepID=UPI001F181DB5|nr:hypothetical protein [Chitinophaga filiformis]MCF6405666.1 hypothetical protein [Chitinophaga filiformis]